MGYQRELEAKLLWRLYVRVHEGAPPMTSNALKASAKKSWNISDFRFDDAFQNLQRWRYLKEEDASVGGEPTFRLSARGVDWVEGWYEIEPDGNSTYNFYQRHRGMVYVDELRNEYVNRLNQEKNTHTKQPQSHFWTKWGSIAAIAAIPTSILIWYFT